MGEETRLGELSVQAEDLLDVLLSQVKLGASLDREVDQPRTSREISDAVSTTNTFRAEIEQRTRKKQTT